MHNSIAQTSTATSRLPERSVTANLTAEIMNDLDDGSPNLLASTTGNLSDLTDVSPVTLLQKVRETRAQLDQIEHLANEYAAEVVIPALLEQYGIELIEADTAKLAEGAPELAAGFRAWSALKSDGTFTVVVPVGQSPVERLAVIRDLVLDLQVKAAAA